MISKNFYDFLVDTNDVFWQNRLKISGIITNFTVADRLAEAPVWG